MQLLKNIYLVGGRHFFLTMRDDADCNVYAVRTDDGVVLIDCGYDEDSLKTIFKTLGYWGMQPSEIRHVLLTHSHYDHTGNARRLQEMGAKVVAHRAAAEALAAGDERTIPYAFFRGDFPTCRVDVELGDRETLRVGDWSFEAINVPGHTDGSMVYLTECDGKRVMFVGDFVFHERPDNTESTLAWAGGTEHDTDKFLESLLRIQQIRVDVLLPGHNGFLLEHGSAIVDNALMVAFRAWGNKFSERRRAGASARGR